MARNMGLDSGHNSEEVGGNIAKCLRCGGSAGMVFKASCSTCVLC